MLVSKLKGKIVLVYNYLIALLPIRLANRWMWIDRQMNWSISIYEGTDSLTVAPTNAVKNPVLSRRDVTDTVAAFVADPFMVKIADDWLMFFEVFNHKRYQGEIAFARSQDGYHWTYQHIILAEDFHLSYPYVFEFESNWYMIPESCEANSIRLYRAKKFPDTWEFVKEILVGSRFVDASILHFNDVWWLFVGVEPTAGSACSLMRLYYADSPLGNWVEHPMSPIVSDSLEISRPAGRMRQIADCRKRKAQALPTRIVSLAKPLVGEASQREENGGQGKAQRPIRFAQDCTKTYGHNVTAIQIDLLTKTEYAESKIQANGTYLFELGTMSCNQIGMHHIDFISLENDRGIACVDSR